MSVDPLRHLSVFSPEAFGNQRVDVIGAGATGSAIVLELAKLGVKNLHVWDFDTVEGHNLANQAFGLRHVGMKKVDALAELAKDFADVEIVKHDQKVEAGVKVTGKHVFLLTDTMSSRKEIGEKCLRLNIQTKAVYETRMGVETGYVYTFNPNSPGQYGSWTETLFDDAQAATSACGASITIGATAKMIASFAVWQFLKVVAGDEFPNEILVSTTPHLIQTRDF